MKKFFLFLVFIVLSVGFVSGQTTYTWVGPNNGSWATAANWSSVPGGLPRTTPATTDILQFNDGGTYTVTGLPTTQTIRQLVVSNNSNITLHAAASGNVLSINGAASTANLSVASGSTLTLGSSVAFTLNFVTTLNQQGSIAGTLNVNASNTFTTTTLTTSPGVTVTGTLQNNGGTINGNATSLNFASGGTYIHAMNGGAIPTATWNAASNCNITGITTIFPTGTSFGQTFGNILWNCTGFTAIATPLASTNIPAQVNGLFEVRSTGGTNILDLSNVGTRTWAGSILVSGGRLALLRGSTPTTMNLTVNSFTVNDGVGGLGTNSMVFFNNSSAASSTANLTVNGAFTANPINNVSQILRFSGVSTNTFSLNVRGNYSHSNGTVTSGGTNNITFNGTTTQTYSAVNNLAINANVSIAANAIVDFGSNIIQNTGTFSIAAAGTLITANDDGVNASGTNSGTIQSSGTRTYTAGSSYTFNGGAAQIFGTGLPASIANLTINNSNTTAGMNLAANTTVTGTLNLTGGVINLNNFDLTLSNTTITTQLNSASPSATAMVRTNGTGRLIRYMPATAGTFLYPIGTGTTYSPVNMVFTANNTIRNLGFRAVDAFAPVDLTSTDRLSRYWVSTLSVSTGTYAYTATFGYDVAGDVVGAESNIRVNRYANTGVWYQPGTVAPSGGSMAITASVSEAIASGELNNTTFTGRVNPTQYCFRSVVSGNWNSASTWEQDAGCLGSWVPATVVPDLSNAISVLIRNGHTVTVTADLAMNKITIDNTINSRLIIPSGVNFTLLSIPSGGAALTLSGINGRLQIDGTFINQGAITGSTAATTAVNSGGTYQHNQDGGIIPTATWNTNSTCLINGVVLTAPTNFAQTFFDVTWNCPNQIAIAALTGTNNPVQVNGTFLIQNTGTVVGSDIIDFSTISRTWAGNLRITGGRLFLLRGAVTPSALTVSSLTMDGAASANYQLTLNNSTAATSTATLTVTGNVTISPTNNISTILSWGPGIVGQTATLACGGNFNHTNGTLGGFLSTYNLNFVSGGTSKTFSSSTSLGIGVNLNFNANTVTLNSNATLGGSSTTNNVALSSGATLDLNGNTLAFTGTWSNPAGATVNASATNSTIRLWGTLASQTFTASTGTYTGNVISNFIVDNSIASGVTLGTQSATLAYNNVTINTGRVLNLSSNTLRLSGSWTNNGTLTATSGNAAIEFCGTAPQTFTVGTYTTSVIGLASTATGGIIINNSAGVTLGANINVAKLTLTAGKLNTDLYTIRVLGTSVDAVVGGSTTSYVNGPLERAFPTTALATGTTYTFPIGKSIYNQFELINPVMAASTGQVIRAEVFDSENVGTVGTGFTASPNPARHWVVEKVSGSGTGVFSSIGAVELVDGSMTLTSASAIGHSPTSGGQYNTLGGILAADIMTNAAVPVGLGYFKIGSAGCLSGTYTIGTGGDFTNLTSAVSTLNGAQVCSNLLFELLGTYNGNNGSGGTETFPIAINQLNYNSSGPYTVTFRPQTGVTARVTSGTPVGTTASLISFNGADRVIFDGRPGGSGTVSEWILRNAQTASAGPAVMFINDSKRDTLRYLTLESSANGPSTGIVHISTSASGGTGNDSLGILNNTIIDNTSATGVPTSAIFSIGTAGALSDYITIANNNISLFSTYGINVSTNSGIGWKINNNNLFNATTCASAIYLNSTPSVGFTVTGNKIGGNARDVSGNITGVWSNGATAFTGIEINNFAASGAVTTISDNIIQAYNGSGSFTGILVGNGIVDVTNNLIGHTNSANSLALTGTVFTGIQFGASTTVDINGNKIAGVTLNNSGITSCNGILGNVASNISVRNNTISRLIATASNTAAPNMFGISVGATAATSVTVNQNTIKSLYLVTGSGAAKITGINYTGPSGTQDVSNNNIHSFRLVTSSTSGNMTGIALNAGSSHCYNNMIRLGIDSTGASVGTNHIIRGIDAVSTGNYTISHNSVYIGGTAAASNSAISAAFYKTTTGTTNLVNNIFVNNRNNGISGTARNTAVYAVNTTNLTGCNYNLYQATGTGGALATYDNGFNYRTTIADIIANTVFDDNSISGDPQFIAPTAATPDLHISTTNPTPIEGVGTSASTRTTDFDGETRSSLTPVDIGADAGNFIPIDQTPPGITINALSPACNGTTSFSFTADITDGSAVQKALGARPRVYFKKSTDNNDLTGWKYSEATSISGNQYSFTIDFTQLNSGSVSPGNIIQYFVVAQDSGATVFSPNVGINAGTFAATPASVALTTTAFGIGGTPTSFVISPCQGTITVGSSGADYTSLTNAGGVFEAINLAPLTGDLVVNIKTNLTNESGSVALNQWSETGVGNYTLTVKSDTNIVRYITSTSAATGGLIKLNGADRVTFKGGYSNSDRRLVIQNIVNNNAGASTISFSSDATNNTFTYCTIEGSVISTGNGVISFGTTTGTGNDFNTITYCDIKDYNGSLPYNAVYSSGNTTSGKENNNNTISYCNISNYFYAGGSSAGILIVGGNLAWTIDNNKFFQTGTRNITTAGITYGININNSSGGGFLISNNYIGGNNISGTGTMTYTSAVGTQYAAIQVYAAPTPTTYIQNNTIKNISFSTISASSADIGMLSGIYTASGSFSITGNTIGSTSSINSVLVTLNSTSGGYTYGIKNDASGTITISNNTIAGIADTTTSGTNVAPGINAINTTAGTNTISNNYIGSPTITGSLRSYSNATTNGANVSGIVASSTATISNNSIASLVNNNSGTGAGYTGGIITSGNLVYSITGNTIRRLSSTSKSTSSGSTSSVIGIALTSTNTGAQTISNNTIHTLINTGSSANTVVTGIFFSGGTSTSNSIDKNTVHSLVPGTGTAATVTGIFLNGGAGSVSNNVVRLGIAPNGSSMTQSMLIYGILKNTTSGINSFYYNSVYIGGTGVASGTNNTYAFYRNQSTSLADVITNNIFANARTNAAGSALHFGLAVNTLAGLTAANFDYNIFASANNNELSIAAVPTTIAGSTPALRLQTLRGQAANIGNNLRSGIATLSKINFVNATGDTAAISLQLNIDNCAAGAGLAISTINSDAFGNSRSISSTTPTTIGAHEGSFNPINATNDVFTPIVTMVGPPSTIPICGPTNVVPFYATITDVGTGLATGTDAPVMWWKTTAGSWSSANTVAGTLVSGNTYSFVPPIPSGANSYQYYIVAQDQATAPNVWYSIYDASTPVHSNTVTQVTAPVVSPGTFTTTVSGSSLSGTYTVGSGGNYTTLTAAVNAYNTSCLTGPVVFSLTGSTYNAGSGESFPIQINNNPYASSTNTLTIKPATGVSPTITGASNVGVIVFNGCSYVTLDGSNSTTSNTVCPASSATKNLTVINSNTTYGSTTPNAVIWLQNNGTTSSATYNTVKNCIVRFSGCNSASATGIGIGSNGTAYYSLRYGNANNYNSIINNDINNSASTCLNYGVIIQGGSASNKDIGNVVSQNTIGYTTAVGQTGYITSAGIAAGWQDQLTISGNTINGVYSSTWNVAGIGLGTVYSGGGSGGLMFFDALGLPGNEVTNSTVTNNKIGLVGTDGAGRSAGGIVLSSASSGTNLVANNTISGVYGWGGASYFDGSTTFYPLNTGIYVGGGTGTTNIYHNTVRNASTFFPDGDFTAFYNVAIAGSNPIVNIKNNILFTDLETSSNYYQACIATLSTTYSNLNSNNNVFYNSGGASTESIGKTGGLRGGVGTHRTTLANWQSATGQDANSANQYITFNSVTDLQPLSSDATNQTYLNGTGVPLAAVTEDIVCAPRDPIAPSIGAFEMPRPIDISPVAVSSPCPGTQTVTVSIKNLSASNTINTATVNWTVNGVAQTAVNLSGMNLLAGATAVYNLGSFTFANGTQYTIVATTSSPNAQADGVPANDTYTSISYAGFPATVYVGTGVGTPSYATFSDLFAAINNSSLTQNVTVLVQNNVTEPSTPVFLNATSSCSGGPYTITIRPATATVYTATGSSGTTDSPGMIGFNGASNVIINGNFGSSGQYLRFRNTNGSYPTIAFVNDANSITITNSVIEGNNGNTYVSGSFTTPPGTVYFGNAATGGSGNRNITISNNDISNRTDATGIPANAIFSYNATAGTGNNTNTISNNLIHDFSQCGVYLTATGTGASWNISNNKFYCASDMASYQSSVPLHFSIYNAGGSTSHSNIIDGNIIGGSTSNNTGTWTNSSSVLGFEGIRLEVGGTTGQTSIVRNNEIKNINLTGTGLGWFIGIRVMTGLVDIDANTIGSLSGTSIQYAGNGSGVAGNNDNSFVYGIWHYSTGATAITNNIVAGLNNTGGACALTGIRRGAKEFGTVLNPFTTYGGLTTITGNTIANLSSNSRLSSVFLTGTNTDLVWPSALTGIAVNSDNANTNSISNNTIYNLSAYGTWNRWVRVFGLALNGNPANPRTNNGVANNNKIYNLTNTNGGIGYGPQISGIEIGFLNSTGSYNLSNNMVSLYPTVASSANKLEVYGIIDVTESGGSNVNKLFNNSVYIGGTATTSSGFLVNSYAYFRLGSGDGSTNAGSATLANNIFVNERTGGDFNFAIGNETPNPSVGWTSSNYNFLAAPNATYLANWGGFTADFNDWKTSSGGDASSWSVITAATSSATQVKPSDLFNDVTTADLTIKTTNQAAWFVNGKGAAGTIANNLNTDIQGDARGTVYGFGIDIGADEFVVNPVTNPPHTLTATPAANTTNTFTFAGRTIGSVKWGATFPVSVTMQYYSSQNPGDANSFAYVGTDKSNFLYDISVPGGSTPSYPYQVKLYYDDALLGGFTGAESTMKIIKTHQPSGEWIKVADQSVGINTTTNILTSVDTTMGFSFWGGGNQQATTPLPVELVNFDATCDNNGVIVTWTTATETNNDFFTVQRSENGVTYTNIGIVGGAGNSNTLRNYTFKDENTLAGMVYYRLMQTDFNGQFETFGPKWVDCKTRPVDDVVIYPNPAQDQLYVNISLSDGDRGTIAIYNHLGQVISTRGINAAKGFNNYTLDVSGLAAGQYFVTVTLESKVLPVQKLTITK